MQQLILCFGNEHFQILTSKLLCAPLSFFLLAPRSRGWSSAAGDQSQQSKRGSYIKMEDYTSCSAGLIKKRKKTSRLLSFSVLDVPLVLRFINCCEETWSENVVLDRNLWVCGCLQQHWDLLLAAGAQPLRSVHRCCPPPLFVHVCICLPG